MVATRSSQYAEVPKVLQYLKDTMFPRFHFSCYSPLTLQLTKMQGNPTDHWSLQGIAYFLVIPSSLSITRNKLSLLSLVLRQNIMHLLAPQVHNQALWLRWFLHDLGVDCLTETSIHRYHWNVVKIPTIISFISILNLLKLITTSFMIICFKVLNLQLWAAYSQD